MRVAHALLRSCQPGSRLGSQRDHQCDLGYSRRLARHFERASPDLRAGGVSVTACATRA